MENPQQNDKIQFLRIDEVELLQSKQLGTIDFPTFTGEKYYLLFCPRCGNNLTKKNDGDGISNFACSSCKHTFCIWIEDLTAQSEKTKERVISNDNFSLVVLIYGCNESMIENNSLNDKIVDYLLKSDTWYTIQSNRNDIDSLIKNETNEQGDCIVFVIKNIDEYQDIFSGDKLSRLAIERTLKLMAKKEQKLFQKTKVNDTFLTKLKFKKP
jgi:DNA-directed RNA polymerase subunit M/transcription elongation factor TFIIS